MRQTNLLVMIVGALFLAFTVKVVEDMTDRQTAWLYALLLIGGGLLYRPTIARSLVTQYQRLGRGLDTRSVRQKIRETEWSKP